MNHFNFNGKIFEAGKPVIGPGNRGLRYGDGLFETLKFKNKELILADEHFARLWKGMQLLKFDIPKLFTPDHLQQQIHHLIQKNKQDSARVRLSIFRGDGGLYDSKTLSPNFLIESWTLEADHANLNENGLQMCIYRDAKKPIDHFSNIKHNNYLPYFMGALYAKEKQCNDALILNDQNRICDSTIANIFMIKDEQIITPALNEGCVAGVMRKFILQHASSHEFQINETAITTDMVLDADEVFLSNSIYNIRWVAAIDEKKYSHTTTSKLFDLLQKTNPLVFC